MSILIDDPAAAATGGATLALLAGLVLWRLGIQCERGWLRADAAPPEPFEEALFERMAREEARKPGEPPPAEPSAQDEHARELALA